MSVIQNVVNTNLPLTGNRLGSRRNQSRRKQITNATIDEQNDQRLLYCSIIVIMERQ